MSAVLFERGSQKRVLFWGGMWDCTWVGTEAFEENRETAPESGALRLTPTLEHPPARAAKTVSTV
ncbi:hypothetical protein PpBr36_08519 [Pyricularia pennisetigena]|uniref:hypothetical protein n=1 Tax=Pyricularia pennisetigena TaxID=1578925 RepID=UPI0011533E85|nr:hypothetical protein PpBr36_08519 [Pyricularia pennisetigena]TLS24094.1 hypothetical protein PpBr36_08519 [Pyricularia pennisetigena]